MDALSVAFGARLVVLAAVRQQASRIEYLLSTTSILSTQGSSGWVTINAPSAVRHFSSQRRAISSDSSSVSWHSHRYHSSVNPLSLSRRRRAIYSVRFASTTNPTNESKPVTDPKQNTPRAIGKETAVPSSQFSRLWHYGGLAMGMGAGAVSEVVKRATGQSESSSVILTPNNAERLVSTLSRMRGAALKLGQMLSIQDNDAIPPEIRTVLERVRKTADFMPRSQREKILVDELGKDWRDRFQVFDDLPIAAASIGQVHKAQRQDGQWVAMKIQYPGVSKSIIADLSNLKTVLIFSSVLPKGLFLDRTIEAAKIELGWETDYKREAFYTSKFGQLLQDDVNFGVPKVFQDLTTKSILTTEWMEGVPVEKVAALEQDVRNEVSLCVLRLCLREIFEFRTMQTDPNWSNFLYDAQNRKLNLIDFGATREFGKPFTDKYLRVIMAAAARDRDGVRHWSRELGYLTGDEPQVMVNAHIDSVLVLAEPFSSSKPTDFRVQDISKRVSTSIPTMLKYRLTPPPEETYSLHRKLSGAFLLCAKLGAVINCRDMFDQVVQKYQF